MKFSYKYSLIDDSQIVNTAETLKDYRTQLQHVITKNNYEDAESSINLPSDAQLAEAVVNLKNILVSPKLKYIIDIGIGGSNLGTKAIYDTLYGFFDPLQPERFPKIIFADTNDPEFLQHLIYLLDNLHDDNEVIINIISKSGGTTETIANAEIIIDRLKQKFPNILRRVVITTDKNSPLWQTAISTNIETLEIPKTVGGRYSVFSAVGLFPLACCGIDIESLRQGARAIQTLTTQEDILHNPALISAVTLYLHSLQNKNVHDSFFFHPEMESLGKWYRQLLGESIGKDGKGITPTVSIGSTDLHSVGQLYLGGPKDKITTFVTATTSDIAVPETRTFPHLIETISGKTASHIMRAIQDGVTIAYQKQGLPYMEILLDDLSEKSLGEFMQFKMIEMMYLGKLMQVNPFDQPHVELYKIETKKLLSQ